MERGEKGVAGSRKSKNSRGMLITYDLWLSWGGSNRQHKKVDVWEKRGGGRKGREVTEYSERRADGRETIDGTYNGKTLKRGCTRWGKGVTSEYILARVSGSKGGLRRKIWERGEVPEKKQPRPWHLKNMRWDICGLDRREG